MDSSERARYKQLANDSIIATFGRDTNEARLAQALEKCIEELERLEQSPHCSTCSCGLLGHDEAIAVSSLSITEELP